MSEETKQVSNRQRGRKALPENQGNIFKTNVRLDAEMKEKMREAMRDEGDESESVFIRKLIRRHLKQWEKDQ